MFIKNSAFRSLIKEAYKGPGLTVQMIESGFYLSGGYWQMYLRRDLVTKKMLGALIELTGELPEVGESFRATEGGNQIEINDTRTLDILKASTKEPLTLTAYSFRNTRILQAKDNKIYLLAQHLLNSLSLKDKTPEETVPGGPYKMDGIPGAIWKNEAGVFLGLFGTHDDDETVTLLESMELEEWSIW